MDVTAPPARQRRFFQTGATRPLAFRKAQLQKLHDALAARESILITALHSDLRKSPAETFASELGLVLGEIRHALRHLASWMKPRRASIPWLAWPARGAVHPEPYGVALILGPWNYPLQLLLSPLVGAIAAGNCAVLKPSEFAPRAAAAILDLIHSAFPPEYISAMPGDRETAEALLREKFDVIFFTGSASVGRSVMTAAARHLTPVTLELGGKSPCIVRADAPLDLAARRILWGKFLNAGQTCVAPDFVLVERRVRDQLTAAMQKTLLEFYGEDPQRSPDFGRIVNQRHLNRLIGYLQSGRILHGGTHDANDLYLAPTLLAAPPLTDPVMQEEIFGPILPILPFDHLDEALDLLRDRPAPLALYLFSKDRKTQDRVLNATRSGGVCVNDTLTHILGFEFPFGGLGESGIGAYHGRASFDCFTHRRSVLRRSLLFDPKLRYPPARVGLETLRKAFRFLTRG